MRPKNQTREESIKKVINDIKNKMEIHSMFPNSRDYSNYNESEKLNNLYEELTQIKHDLL